MLKKGLILSLPVSLGRGAVACGSLPFYGKNKRFRRTFHAEDLKKRLKIKKNC